MTKVPQLVLVMPPESGLLRGFSSALVCLAGFVQAKLPSSDPLILDLSLSSSDSLLEAVEACVHSCRSPLVIGITTTTASYQAALATARAFKRFAPECIVALGGHHATGDAETIVSSHPGLVDIVVAGEGEIALLELLRHAPRFKDVPGAVFIEGGRVVRTLSPPFLTTAELDSLPITYPGDGLTENPGKFGSVTYVSARGCPIKCAFCSVANERIRAKSIPHIIEDLRELLRMGFTRVAIEDNFFAHSQSRTQALCGALKSLLPEADRQLQWDCQTRVESLARPNTIPLLSGSGCVATYIGVESFNSDHLIYLNKTPNPVTYVRTLVEQVTPHLLDSSVNCYINLQFGIPGETSTHYEQTAAALQHIGGLACSRKKSITVYPQLYVDYPGTTNTQLRQAQGLYKSGAFETFTEWEAEQRPILNWLGEHFAHGTGGIPFGLLNIEALRSGRYELCLDKVLQVSTGLKILENIDGIRIFAYGRHLARSADPVSLSK